MAFGLCITAQRNLLICIHHDRLRKEIKTPSYASTLGCIGQTNHDPNEMQVISRENGLFLFFFTLAWKIPSMPSLQGDDQLPQTTTERACQSHYTFASSLACIARIWQFLQ